MIPDSIVGTDVCLWKAGIHVRGSEGEVLRRGGKESDGNQAGSFIEANYWIRYTPRHIREMLRNREFQHAKPYDVDYRRLTEAEATLKKTRSIHGVSDGSDVIWRLHDESAQKTSSRTAKLWSTRKPIR